MHIVSGDTAKILFGLFLFVAGVWNAAVALRAASFPYIWGGIGRDERPIFFWLLIIACAGLAFSGLDLLASGVLHVHTFWG